MAPRASSRRASASASGKTLRESYSPRVESAEVKRSRRAAILQLKMGRLAHILGIASGLALALTAVVAYGLQNWDWEFFSEPSEFVSDLKWTIPLIAGMIVALVALAAKWEPYVADKNEPHFLVSLFAVIVPAMLLTLLFTRGSTLFESSDWLFPASLLGFSLTEISLAMTWEGTSSRKTISIAAAIFPIVLLSFPLVYRPADVILANILPMAYLGSAVAIQLSGSMLHIISSSTATQQREVLKASDSRFKEQLVEIEKKRRAIEYREDALRSKESDLETDLKKFSDEVAALEERKVQVASLEAEIEQRLQGARETRQNVAKQESSLEKERESLQLKFSDINSQRGELEKLSKSISAREAAIAARDRETSKLQLDLQSKEREIRGKLAEIESESKAIAHTSKELEDLQAALAEREKQLGVRESSLDLKSLEILAAKEQLGKVSVEKTAMKNLEQQLLMKQESLAEKEIAIKAMEDEVRKKAEKSERLSVRADQQLNELVDRESKLLEKEKLLADKEASLKADLQGLTARLEDIDRTKAAFSDREKQYQDLTETTRTKLTSVSTREEELGRKMTALEKREGKIKELELVLKGERDKMNTTLRQLLEKEKDLKAEETELSLRHAELKQMEREILERVDEIEAVRVEEPAMEDEREKTLEVREQRLIEKEQEIKSRLYQREKELEKKELALRAQLSKDLEEMEESVEEEYKVEKVKTGTERLDDLLMGGMPFGSNVLFVGPPFIGKEVAMLIFLAEGLKKGVPAVIVTTSKSPSEISKDMAPILPTFMEFDQLGLVRWIDASSIEGAEMKTEDSHSWVLKVSGPADFEGITKALEKCIKDFEKQKHPYFRLAYMSLSMSMTQANEKIGLQFLQGFSGRVKQARGVSAYTVERGMHTEQQLEAMQHHMTGALQFKTDKQKTLMSVQGVGDVQTRDWIEYKHSNRALMIGAFSLERIR